MSQRQVGLINLHSHFSLLRGLMKVKPMVESAKEKGYTSLALVDNSNLYGAIEFYKTCKEFGIKPMIGVTLFINQETDTNARIILLAKNNEGYKNLLQLITLTHFTESKTTQPTLNENTLESYTKSLIAIMPPLNSAISLNEKNSTKILKKYKKYFGDNLYIGMDKNKPELMEKLREIAKENNVKTIPCPSVYYDNKEDKEIRDTLLKIQPSNRPEIEDETQDIDYSMPVAKEIEEEYEKSDLENLSNLIESIDIDIELGKWIFPKPPEVEDSDEMLKKLVQEGLEKRKMEETKEVKERIEFELSVIIDRGYANYYLTVIDIVNFTKENKILTATRGSVAGSLISYLTGISNIDPIEFKLPFERFLNPFRPSPPDIDLDIADDRRGEVIKYISQKFGKQNTAQIGTFGTMMARAVVRDTARALGYSYTTGDRIAKLIPLGKQGMPMTIDKAFGIEPQLEKLYESEESVKNIIDTAKKLEGNVKHISTHAGGIVISPKPIVNYCPVQPDPKGENKIITQFNMHDVESVGLLKFDILGLTNLSILSKSIENIKKRLNIDVDIEDIKLDDEKTFQMIQKGLTTGVFQLGGIGITSVLKKMKPTSLHDISALIALYRPGPMSNIDEYIDRKHGREKVKYFHPKMKKYLDRSYGVLVYQDDLLYTALELAKYDWKEVDVFRKAVGKKIPELMRAQEKEFKKRIIENTEFNKEKADMVWKLFSPFAGYGFNKAHAISYAIISYQTAYVKANYPADYMTAHLTAESGDTDKIAVLMHECRRMGIPILPPSINKSGITFTTESLEGKDAIRVGLGSIKNVGSNIIDKVIELRERNGEFTSLENFVSSVSKECVLNKRSFESLVKVGALDDFGERKTILGNLELILQYGKEIAFANKEQSSLFLSQGETKLNLEKKEKLEKAQGLYWEKQLLGVYTTGHPLQEFKDRNIQIDNLKKRRTDKEKVAFLGVINSIKKVPSRNGKQLFFIKVEDETETIETVCFQEQIDKFEELLAFGRCIKVFGETFLRNGEMTLRLERVENPI